MVDVCLCLHAGTDSSSLCSHGFTQLERNETGREGEEHPGGRPMQVGTSNHRGKWQLPSQPGVLTPWMLRHHVIQVIKRCKMPQ